MRSPSTRSRALSIAAVRERGNVLKTLSQKHSEFMDWQSYVLEEWTRIRLVRSAKAYETEKHEIDPLRYSAFVSDLLASIGRVEKKHAL
jgi:lambda repressor-like predicted transcriptional regulator